MFRPGGASTLKRSLFAVACLCVLVLVPVAGGSHTPAPTSVGLPGSFGDELGCPGDWQPDCSVTQLAFDAEDRVWQGAFDVPAGSWEYKAALNGSWDENYGAARAAERRQHRAQPERPAASVKFYYDHATHWITDNHNSVIATAPGSYQTTSAARATGSRTACAPGSRTRRRRHLRVQHERDPGRRLRGQGRDQRELGRELRRRRRPERRQHPVHRRAGRRSGSVHATTRPRTCSRCRSRRRRSRTRVTIPGSFQPELGCPSDWQPDCATTQLSFDASDRVWQGTFNVPAGDWEYKAALNDTWDVNYGANAQLNGPNIGLSLAAPTAVKFYYDHATHWVTDNHNSVIATAPGSYQSEIGCPGDWQPDCLRSWLEDPDGDGIYQLLHRMRSRPATTRPRPRSTRAGTRTTAPAASRTARTSRSPCPRRHAESSSPTTRTSHVLTISQGRSRRRQPRPREGALGDARHPRLGPRRRRPRCGRTTSTTRRDGGLDRGPRRHHRRRDDRPHAGPELARRAEGEVPAPRRLPAFGIDSPTSRAFPRRCRGSWPCRPRTLTATSSTPPASRSRACSTTSTLQRPGLGRRSSRRRADASRLGADGSLREAPPVRQLHRGRVRHRLR